MASDPPSCGKRATFERLDRISDLPKEVIDEILHSMPIRDAVKTSLLSRDWRYSWTSMPHLVFNKRSISSSNSGQNNLANFVSKALFLHNDIISKFELNHFLQTSCSDIDHWILVLSKKDLHHFALRFEKSKAYHLPAFLFSCQSLRNLNLGGCILNLPSSFQGFKHLTFVRLSLVTLTNETFQSLVSKIPFLQALHIRNCKPLSHLNIHAPNLEVLIISGCCESIKFSATQNVNTAAIHIWQPGFPIRCRLDEFLTPFNAVQRLRLYHPFLEISPMGHVLKRLEIDYHHLKEVKLYVNIEDSKQIVAALCLCRSAPLLQKLRITAVWNREAAVLYENHFWEKELQREDNILHHLETVTLRRFKGVNHDIGLTQFILLNALVLETLSINWEEGALLDEKTDIVENMMQCPRASTKAKVVFNTQA